MSSLQPPFTASILFSSVPTVVTVLKVIEGISWWIPCNCATRKAGVLHEDADCLYTLASIGCHKVINLTYHSIHSYI